MKAAGPLNLPSVHDQGPVSSRRDLNNPAIEGFMRAASARDAGAQALARGLNAFAAGLDKLGEDRDRAKALEAYNNYVSRSSQMLYNADNGFMNAQGAGAEGLAARVGEAHDGLREEITSGLNGRQKRMFMESVSSYDRDVANNAMRYEGRAMTEYRKSEGLKSLDNMAATWAASPDDISMETQEDAVNSIASAIYGDQGEKANAENRSTVRSQFVARTALLLAERDPIRAESFIKENGELMEPSARESVSQKVQEAALGAHIQEDTPALFNEYGIDGLVEAREYIRDNYSGTEENKRLSAAESYWREMQQNRNEEEAKAYDNIIGLMEGGASSHQVKEAIDSFSWSTNRAKRQVEEEYERHYRIGDYAPQSSGRIETDRETLLTLYDLQDSGTLLEAAPDWATFKARFGDRLSTSDIRKYRKYYSDLEKGSSKSKVTLKMNYNKKFADKLKKAGIKDERKIALFYDRFNEEYDEMVQTSKGRPITNEMVLTQMDDLLKEEVVDTRTTWWGGTRDVKRRRGEIPRELLNQSYRGNDGGLYIKDENGDNHPLLFEGSDAYRDAERAGAAAEAEADND